MNVPTPVPISPRSIYVIKIAGRVYPVAALYAFSNISNKLLAILDPRVYHGTRGDGKVNHER